MAPQKIIRFVLGLLAGVAVPLILAEAHVRYHPPADMQPFLGDESGLKGSFRPDPELCADYATFENFRADYSARLTALGALDDARPTWLWFGNSFVQAPGMLGDAAQAAMPKVRMFYLQRNERPWLRIAQMRALLEHGLHPERIIFALLPVDAVSLCQQPLESIYVNSHGAITTRLRMPAGPLAALIRHSKLATLAWIRSGRHVWNPGFRMAKIGETLPPPLPDDLRQLVSVIGGLSRKHSVPVTVLLIPNREQIAGKSKFAFQDSMIAMCREQGLACFDARNVFAGVQEKQTIFLPDWHFTPRGNELLLAALLEHFKETKNAGEKGAP